MIVTNKVLLDNARRGGYAVPAFNVDNLESVIGVLRAAENTGRPVIVQTIPRTLKYGGIPAYSALVRALYKGNPDISIHLDHGGDVAICKACIDAGYTSVMIDGSALPFEENGKKVYGDLGYFIDPKYGEHGYATEAVRGLVHHFFKVYKKLDITAHPANKFSRKLIERIGGKQVGYNAASHYGHGEPRAVFEVHKEDFYRSSPYYQKMPNLLTLLINRQRGKK